MKLLVACHDAGGAEIVSAWLRRHRAAHRVAALLEGPAVSIFARKLGALAPPPRSLAGLDLVLTGSSGAATLERRTLRAARAAGVRSAVWLDHWTGYAERLMFDGELVLPDEAWVGDPHAARLAAAALPGVHVRLAGNPYLEDEVAEVHALAGHRPAGAGGERILYVTEPTAAAAARVAGDPAAWGYDEHLALAGYLDHLARTGAAPAAIRVRPHPAEPAGKYDPELARWAGRLPVALSRSRTLAEDCAWADTVAGCETMAMVVALHAGRRVVCAIPPGGRPPALPFPEIERLAELRSTP